MFAAVLVGRDGARQPARRGRAPATSASRPAPARRARSTPSPTSPASRSVTRPSSTGDAVRTGVTAILPHGGNLFREKVPGAVFVGNAFGKLAGSTQVEELGTIETPIVLTNTLSVGAALDARRPLDGRAAGQRERAIGERARRRNQRRHAQRHPRLSRHARARDGGDRRREEPARSTKAPSAPAPARSRSAGRAASARRRASSRQQAPNRWTVGVLVQTNYGGRLTIGGVPVWRELTPGGKGIGPIGRPPSRHSALRRDRTRSLTRTGPA